MSRMTDKEKENWHKYHIPGCGARCTRKVNALFLSPANSLRHELEKACICYEILSTGGKFITEAVRNKKDATGKERRPDIVDLGSGIEFEIEMDPKRAARFDGEQGIVVIKAWEKKPSGVVVTKAERFPCKEEAGGSIPPDSITTEAKK